jgi:hypothetical protein
MKRDVSKVCHACAFWNPIPTLTETGEPAETWRCSINAAVTMGLNTGRAVTSVYGVIESVRNHVFAERAAQIAAGDRPSVGGPTIGRARIQPNGAGRRVEDVE